MFRKGVITDEISQDFEKAAALAAQYHLDGVEIRSVWEKNPHELDEQDIDEMKAILAHRGLAVCGISSPFFKCDIDSAEEIRANVENLKKTIRLAHALHTSIIRGFTFWKKGDLDANLGKITSRFEEPLRLLENEGITLALEFDPSVFATDAAQLVRVIRSLGSPLVKGLWDPGNDIFDPGGEVPFPTGYELIKPYLAHMHLKDAVRRPDGTAEAVPVGEGEVDYPGHFRALLRDGYEGYVVLETHYRPKHAMDEKLMALPKGSAFSYLGYEATEECLIKWEKLLARL